MSIFALIIYNHIIILMQIFKYLYNTTNHTPTMEMRQLKQFMLFFIIILFLIIIVIAILNVTNITSISLFIPYWAIISVMLLIIAGLLLDKNISKKKK